MAGQFLLHYTYPCKLVFLFDRAVSSDTVDRRAVFISEKCLVVL